MASSEGPASQGIPGLPGLGDLTGKAFRPSPRGRGSSTPTDPVPQDPSTPLWSHPEPTMGQLITKLMGIFSNQGKGVIIVGLDNAGKTTNLYQLDSLLLSDSSLLPSISFLTTRNEGGCEFSSAGQFIILVIDSTDRDRLLTTREELYKMLAHEALRDASVLIFANKQDMKDSMTTKEISQCLTLSTIKHHPWHIQGCCALTGEGLQAGLQWMQSRATAS
ncbi:putative ADP-ribosylation factor-like protein 5C [Erinaceus europaeus]|uniref:ADP-ribosylation factor-like protein 5C n=1 Tax=Erinaceus europaeus TaxID=9365 RepID=A0ABM3YIH5_ERIEU|nr:putative ADP-ribosylation factor-like protein 5C [Erinaceus europaeus]